MQILKPILTRARARRLARELREIESKIAALPKRSLLRLGVLIQREIGQASQCDFPHLYGTSPDARYLPWGQGTAIGFERAYSSNAEVSMRGIALWIAAAYHESKDASHPSLRHHHRLILTLLRELKTDHESVGTPSPTEAWKHTDQAA